MARKKRHSVKKKHSKSSSRKINLASLILGSAGAYLVSNYAATMLKPKDDPKSMMPLLAPVGIGAIASYMKHNEYTIPAISGATASLLALLVTTGSVKQVDEKGNKNKLASYLLPTSLEGETDLGMNTGFYGEENEPEEIQGIAEASIYGMDEAEIYGGVNDPFA